MSPKDIDFSVTEYVQAHGKNPRGRGSWAFCPYQSYRATNYLDFTVWFRGTYAEAKAQARAYFAANGDSTYIVVCS